MFIAEVADLIGRADRAFVTRCEAGMLFSDERRRKAASWHLMDADPQTMPASLAYLKGLLPVLRRAAVFRFENLPLNVGEESYVLPLPDGRGVELFNAGGAAPPFDVCWLEYPIPKGRSVALLVERRGADFVVREFIRYPDDGVLIKSTCLELVCRPAAAGPDGLGFYRGFHWRMESPTGSLPGFVARLAAMGRISTEEAIRASVNDILFFAYMLLVLKSTARRVERIDPPVFANRRRRDKGLMPLPVEHVVTLDAGWAPGEAGPIWMDVSRPLPEFPAGEFV